MQLVPQLIFHETFFSRFERSENRVCKWSNLCLNCIFKWTRFVKTDIWSVIDGSRVQFQVAVALIFCFPAFFSLFWLGFPSVPLEFPKLANEQPFNFGPLRIFHHFCSYFCSFLFIFWDFPFNFKLFYLFSKLNFSNKHQFSHSEYLLWKKIPITFVQCSCQK